MCTQCYGHGAVNYSWWPEDAAKVGKPTGDPIKLASGVWSRAFEHAVVYRQKEMGGSGVSLEPLGLFLRTSIPFIWRVLEF